MSSCFLIVRIYFWAIYTSSLLYRDIITSTSVLGANAVSTNDWIKCAKENVKHSHSLFLSETHTIIKWTNEQAQQCCVPMCRSLCEWIRVLSNFLINFHWQGKRLSNDVWVLWMKQITVRTPISRFLSSCVPNPITPNTQVFLIAQGDWST